MGRGRKGPRKPNRKQSVEPERLRPSPAAEDHETSPAPADEFVSAEVRDVPAPPPDESSEKRVEGDPTQGVEPVVGNSKRWENAGRFSFWAPVGTAISVFALLAFKPPLELAGLILSVAWLILVISAIAFAEDLLSRRWTRVACIILCAGASGWGALRIWHWYAADLERRNVDRGINIPMPDKTEFAEEVWRRKPPEERTAAPRSSEKRPERVPFPWPSLRNVYMHNGEPQAIRLFVWPRDYPNDPDDRRNTVSLSTLFDFRVRIEQPIAVHPTEPIVYNCILAARKFSELSYHGGSQTPLVVVPLQSERTPLLFYFSARGGEWVGRAVLTKLHTRLDTELTVDGRMLTPSGEQRKLKIRERHYEGLTTLETERKEDVPLFSYAALKSFGLPVKIMHGSDYPKNCVDISILREFNNEKSVTIQHNFAK